ncbi:MAG: phosphoribosylformylglycinamidine cyclo-ligase [Planctomycetaceae bacterium]
MNETYKSAGVDLDLYRDAMDRLPAFLRRTHRPGVLELPGGFAGLFRLHEATRYEDPVLVSGTDGVGTKLKIAQMARRYDTVGIDLVAMCVNDCLCLGAEPLFFLDYLAFGRDDPDLVAALVAGVSEGCLRAGAALLGGETAIMPGVYQPDDFDMAGFCVGVVERPRLIDGSAIRPGDAVVGLASSGFHSNGFSLIRKVVFEQAGLTIDDDVPECRGSVADALLEPTTIYVPAVRVLLDRFGEEQVIHGMAHITGGGLAENIERVLPEHRRVRIDRGTWDTPPVIRWFESLGHVEREEMFRVFNMGIGYVLIIEPQRADAIVRVLREQQDTPAWIIGEIEGEPPA